MTGMEHAIEQAAEKAEAVLAPHFRRVALSGVEDDTQLGGLVLRAVEALASAGLLAPAPQPAKWWRVMGADGHLWAETSSESEARSKMRPGDTLYRLWKTERTGRWLPVDPAEGDGRAEP